MDPSLHPLHLWGDAGRGDATTYITIYGQWITRVSLPLQVEEMLLHRRMRRFIAAFNEAEQEETRRKSNAAERPERSTHKLQPKGSLPTVSAASWHESFPLHPSQSASPGAKAAAIINPLINPLGDRVEGSPLLDINSNPLSSSSQLPSSVEARVVEEEEGLRPSREEDLNDDPMAPLL